MAAISALLALLSSMGAGAGGAAGAATAPAATGAATTTGTGLAGLGGLSGGAPAGLSSLPLPAKTGGPLVPGSIQTAAPFQTNPAGLSNVPSALAGSGSLASMFTPLAATIVANKLARKRSKHKNKFARRIQKETSRRLRLSRELQAAFNSEVFAPFLGLKTLRRPGPTG